MSHAPAACPDVLAIVGETCPIDELLKIVDKNTYCASNYFAIISAVEAYTKARMAQTQC